MRRTSNSDPVADSSSVFKQPARLAVFVLLGLLLAEVSTWHIVHILVLIGHGGFDLFGVEARIVIEAMPRYTFSVLGVAFLVLICLAIDALARRRRIALVFVLLASLVHLVIWIRIASNPFQPGWPGTIFVVEEILAIVLLIDMSRGNLLR